MTQQIFSIFGCPKGITELADSGVSDVCDSCSNQTKVWDSLVCVDIYGCKLADECKSSEKHQEVTS